MEKRKSLDKEVESFQNLDQQRISIEEKLDELLDLLHSSELDSDSMMKLKDRFNDTVARIELTRENLKEFERLDNMATSRLELADSLELLLSQYKLDSKVSKKIVFTERLLRTSIFLVSLVLITMGFAMIIMPAPPYFEMFTIFWFSIDDGVTLMDLIALLIILVGVYLFITSTIKKKIP